MRLRVSIAIAIPVVIVVAVAERSFIPGAALANPRVAHLKVARADQGSPGGYRNRSRRLPGRRRMGNRGRDVGRGGRVMVRARARVLGGAGDGGHQGGVAEDALAWEGGKP